uniref:Insulin-like domain-containing protein n=1 Tax=Plectus sambesii TaxID=2011161 RepID=A0A914V371_9BILA
MTSIQRSPTNAAVLALGIVCFVCAMSVGAEKSRICGPRLTKMLISICTPPGAQEACFKGGYAEPIVAKRKHWLLPKWLLKDDRFQESKRRTEGVATQCCENGCDYKYMKSFCCEE